MEERDSLRTVLYGWARFGLFWLINIFATIIGRTAILGIAGTFLPRLALYDNPETLSLISWIIPVWLLIWLFWDDAKRHTAYGLYNPVAVAIIVILTAAVYYAPVFILEYMTDKKVVAVVKNLYFTSFWLSKFNDDPQIYALVGAVIQALLCIVSYLIAHRFYLKKFADEDNE